MATQIAHYLKDWTLAHEAQGVAGNDEGIYFDGLYYWTLANNNLQQLYWNGTSYDVVETISPDLELATGRTTESISNFVAITGDGVHLAVLANITVTNSGPPFSATQIYYIYILDKAGKRVDRFLALNAILNTARDIGYDGKHYTVSWVRSSFPTSHRFRYLDKVTLNQTLAYTNLNTYRTNISFDGRVWANGRDVSGTTRAAHADNPNINNLIDESATDLGDAFVGFDAQVNDSRFADFFELGAVLDGPYIIGARNP